MSELFNYTAILRFVINPGGIRAWHTAFGQPGAEEPRLTKSGQLRLRHDAMRQGGYWMFRCWPGRLIGSAERRRGTWFGNWLPYIAMATASVPISSIRAGEEYTTIGD